LPQDERFPRVALPLEESPFLSNNGKLKWVKTQNYLKGIDSIWLLISCTTKLDPLAEGQEALNGSVAGPGRGLGAEAT